MFFLSFFWLAIVVFMIVTAWKVYEKAGEPGWASLIPIYNVIVMLKIVGKPLWWLIMLIIPGVNLIFAIWMVNMLSKSFGKDEGFTVGLLLLGFVFYPILAFGDARYLGPYGDSAAFQAAQSPQFDFEKRTQPI